MDQAYQLRPIAAADNAAIGKLIKSVLEEFGANKPGTAYYDQETEHLSKIFTTPKSAYWVIAHHNTIVGAGGIFPTQGLDRDTCELVKLYLYAEHRGKGLGKVLIERCLASAKAMGYQYVYLESMPELSQAVELYKKMGFENLNGPLGNSCHFGCSIWMRKALG